MPLNTDLNVSPYFDDFNANNQYYRILFKPGYAVQARELSQVQSTLQNQIESFGNWAFQNGDIVSGCTITDIPILPYIRLADYQSNAALYSVEDLVDTKITSVSSNLQARVLFANNGLERNYPATNILYIKYLNTGTNGETEFSNTDTLSFNKIPLTGNAAFDNVATVNVYSNSTSNTYAVGNSHGIYVTEGVVFLSGTFVKVLTPTYGLVNAYGVAAGNNVVGFKATETIVDSNKDQTLLDNALGYPNENAPGADRLKIAPTIISLDPETAANTLGFNPIATYNFGSLISKATPGANLFSIVGDVVAKRTFEESGNYVVNPFVIDTVTNITANSLPILEANSVYGRINPGVGYAQGERVEIMKTSYINMRRGVDTQVNQDQQITFNYGNYFIVNEVAGTFPFDKAQSVTLYDAKQSTVTNRTFASVSPSGNSIGTAQLRCFTYNSGTPGSNTAQYLVHVFNIKLNNNHSTSQIKSLYYNGTTKGVADVYSNGVIGATSSQLFSFGLGGIKTLRDQSNNNNTSYSYRTHTSTSMYANGIVVINITTSSPGGVDILPYGTGILPSLDAATINLVATANVDTNALTGQINVVSTSTAVYGNNTVFTQTFIPGDLIKVGSTIRSVNNVVNNTIMYVDSNWGINSNAASYYKSFLTGRIIPLQSTINTGYGGYVNITNSTSFTIASGLSLQSALNVDVTYDVLRTTATPAKKIINKNRFVKIDTSSNPKGPWCLGFSDIHQVTAVYGSATNTYSTGGADLTNQFVFGTGQKDTHYDLGYLYPKSGYISASYPYLLVQLDYFSTNTAPGIGFYTVESYPVQDNPTLANSSTIYTKDIPLYVDSGGFQRYLRDYVDFRIPATSTATDTGSIDVSNTTQVVSAIALASVNPSNTLSLSIPTNGLNVPSYGRNLQADYTVYLSRKDLVYITPDNKIKVKEGISSTNPQTPLYPDSGMAVSVINVPPFPSLSSDQVLADQAINQSSKNLIRDTSTAITGSLVTNKVYTMRDIGKLDQRITNLEYYVSLSLLESQATNMTVTDANGLDRFKNGIFVDPFNNFTFSEVSNPEYSVAIDAKNGIARPKFAQETVYVKFNDGLSGTVQKTGRGITLPYTETAFITQPFATKYRSSAHVSAAWNGTMLLLPNFNDNVDLNQTASVNITIDQTTPWKQFAQSPFGSIWGPWQTTQAITTESVVSGTSSVININVGYRGGGNQGESYNNSISAASATAAAYAAAGYQIGSVSTQFVGDHGGNGWGAYSSSSTYAAASDTTSTIIVDRGNVPNYQNIGAGFPVYE